MSMEEAHDGSRRTEAGRADLSSVPVPADMNLVNPSSDFSIWLFHCAGP